MFSYISFFYAVIERIRKIDTLEVNLVLIPLIES